MSRVPCDGTADHDDLAPPSASSKSAGDVEPRREADVRQIHGVGAPHAHVRDQGGVASPEPGVVPPSRQMDGERRPPSAGAEYRDAQNVQSPAVSVERRGPTVGGRIRRRAAFRRPGWARLKPAPTRVSAHHVQRRLRGLELDGFAFAEEAERAGPGAGRRGQGHGYGADRLLGRAAGRAGDAGDAEAEIGPRAGANALGHRHGDRFAHRAVRLQQRRRHAEQRDLGVVGVGDHRRADVARAAGHVGEPRRQQAAGARLRRRHPKTARAQQLAHDLFEPAAVGAEHDLAEHPTTWAMARSSIAALGGRRVPRPTEGDRFVRAWRESCAATGGDQAAHSR